MDSVTRIKQLLTHGETFTSQQLFDAVYDELRRVAAAQMARERASHTLDATGLVHEAFLKLNTPDLAWESRRHFFGAAAEAMRRILIEHGRGKKALKRGGGQARAQVDVNQIPFVALDEERLLAMSEAIERLAEVAPEKAELVKLRYFAGLTIKEAAETLRVSTATADRHWAYARAWLQDALSR